MLGIYTIMATTGAKRENITCQAGNDARLPLCQFLFITRHWQIECHEQAARDLQTACGRQLVGAVTESRNSSPKGLRLGNRLLHEYIELMHFAAMKSHRYARNVQ